MTAFSENMNWLIKPFEALTVNELYAILRLRNEVFVVEQNCVYQDADGKDVQAFHLMGWKEEELVAYSRIFASGFYFKDAAAIGRVITAEKARGKGLGKELLRRSIRYIEQRFPNNTGITISAQRHLQKFYGYFGFKKTGDEYLEDGIPHVRMDYHYASGETG